jgi:hypothetical protein
MKIKLLAAIILGVGVINNVKGQTILNPSFENVNSGPCAYNLNNSTFNGLILNVTAFGTYENCDIINSSCGYGTAQQGDWFVGLSVPPGGILYDAITMELSSPLQAGQTYSLSFYQKKDAGYDSNPIHIGYSLTDTSLGVLAASFPPVPFTTWTLYTVIFTPSLNAGYITLQVEPTTYGWNHIDDLQLTNVTAVEEEKPNATELITYPNPANEKINISFPATTYENVSIQIHSIKGDIVFADENKSTAGVSGLQFPVSGLPNGIYFLSVQTEEELMTKKIMVQH